MPDYVRWMATGGEMHYLPLEKVQKLNMEIVSDTPGAFLPSKVRGGRSYLAFHRELEAIRNIINATRNLIIAEKSLYLKDPKVIHKKIKFASPSGPSIISRRPRDRASTPHQKQNAFLPVMDGLSLDNLEEALTPLSDELSIY